VLVTKLERAVASHRLSHRRAGRRRGVQPRARAARAQRSPGWPVSRWRGPRLNADNAAMIARAGWHRLGLGERSDWTLDARADLALPAGARAPIPNPQSEIRNHDDIYPLTFQLGRSPSPATVS